MPSSIASIREQVAAARVAMLEPGADLTGVLQTLQSAAEELRQAGPETPREELEGLRLELAGAAKLARNGEEFWRGWGRLLGLDPGYSSDGALAAVPTTSRIAVQG